MQLKEFSLISPVIEATDVFRAIETAIPAEVIEQTIGNIKAKEERVSQATIPTGDLFSNCHESVVIRVNDNSPQKSRQRAESAVDKTGEVLASAEQCFD